jgi:non-ribosomal peptide synthase protein (TIGR01720 family)
MCWSLARWTERELALIRVITHGRECLFQEMDSSHTVGWLSTAYPALLHVPAGLDPVGAAEYVASQMAAIPSKGISYGLLRHYANGPEADQLRSLPQAQVHLNFLGRLGENPSGSGLFLGSRELEQPATRKAARREPDIRIKGQVEGGRLFLRLKYHERAYGTERMRELRNSIQEAFTKVLLVAARESRDLAVAA